MYARAESYLETFMSLRQSVAVRTLNGRLSRCRRKCLFSVTNASAPVHSTYAAINASAGLRPSVSYFEPNSKGTTKSSSMTVRPRRKPTNSRNSSCVKWRPTSSTINRGIRKACGDDSAIASRSAAQEGFRAIPKPKMNSLESRTSSKFFVPKFFSGFAESFDDVFLFHFGKRALSFGNQFSQFCEMPFGFFKVLFHMVTAYKYYSTGARTESM
jgi:hypothetical protein